MKKKFALLVLIFIAGALGVLVYNKITETQKICRGENYLATRDRLPFEEDPEEYLQQLNREFFWRIEFLPEEQYGAVILDRTTRRLIISDIVEIDRKIMGGCLAAFYKAFWKAEDIAKENKDRVYYKRIDRLTIRGREFLQVIVILRPADGIDT